MIAGPSEYLGRIDALLVLGRGIEPDGTLSETGFERTKAAVELSRVVLPKVVVFSGGRSWRQSRAGILPPSEGGAMLRYAQQIMSNRPPKGVEFLAEEMSESTVANMVASKSLLQLGAHATLGLMSDRLHFSQGRPQFLAIRVFPNTTVVPLIVENSHPPSADDIAEERRATLVTMLAMTGVNRGDDRAIMRRQRILERLNRHLRR